MFCWWQDCPPTLEGPCRERSPYSPCCKYFLAIFYLVLITRFKFAANGPRSSSSSLPPRKQQKQTTTTTTTTTTTSTQAATHGDTASDSAVTFLSNEYSTDFSSVSNEDGNSTEEMDVSTTTPIKVCIVMGEFCGI